MGDDYICECDNCNHREKLSLLIPLDGDWYTRLNTGREVPAGECRKCGYFSYKIKYGTWVIVVLRKLGLQILTDDDGYTLSWEDCTQAWEEGMLRQKDKDFEPDEWFIVMVGEEG